MTAATYDMTTFFCKTSYQAISGHTRHTRHQNTDILVRVVCSVSSVRVATCDQIRVIADV